MSDLVYFSLLPPQETVNFPLLWAVYFSLIIDSFCANIEMEQKRINNDPCVKIVFSVFNLNLKLIYGLSDGY